jgi:hypothetical protein
LLRDRPVLGSEPENDPGFVPAPATVAPTITVMVPSHPGRD